MVAKDVMQHPALPHGDALRPGIVLFGNEGPLLLIVRIPRNMWSPHSRSPLPASHPYLNKSGNYGAVLLHFHQPVLVFLTSGKPLVVDLSWHIWPNFNKLDSEFTYP